MKRMVLVSFILLSMAVSARAETYSVTAAGCTGSGYDKAVLQTDGIAPPRGFRGMYRCFCNSIAKGTTLDNQYTQLFSNAVQYNLTVTPPKGSTAKNFKVVVAGPATDVKPNPNW
jgi:hypothetical protein